MATHAFKDFEIGYEGPSMEEMSLLIIHILLNGEVWIIFFVAKSSFVSNDFVFLPRKKINKRTKMDERNTIAKNIKRLREASNFTQTNVADYLGVTRSAYSNYETGDREMPLSVMEKLADLYGCDLYMLYSEDDSVLEEMLVTAFRVDNLSADDMKQIAAFKRIVRNSLKMDILLKR